MLVSFSAAATMDPCNNKIQQNSANVIHLAVVVAEEVAVVVTPQHLFFFGSVLVYPFKVERGILVLYQVLGVMGNTGNAVRYLYEYCTCSVEYSQYSSSELVKPRPPTRTRISVLKEKSELRYCTLPVGHVGNGRVCVYFVVCISLDPSPWL